MSINKDKNEEYYNDNNKPNNLFWERIDEINNCIINYIVLYNYKNILDIGAGKNPLIFATNIIDYNTKYTLLNNSIKIFSNLDIDTNKLPFENNSFVSKLR